MRKCFDNKLIYVCSTLKLPFETKPLSFLPVPDKCVCKQAAEDQTKGLQNKRYLYLVSEKLSTFFPAEEKNQRLD